MFKKSYDYNYGINKELQLLPTIKQFLNDNTIYNWRTLMNLILKGSRCKKHLGFF